MLHGEAELVLAYLADDLAQLFAAERILEGDDQIEIAGEAETSIEEGS